MARGATIEMIEIVRSTPEADSAIDSDTTTTRSSAHKHGTRDEARAMLSNIYNRFTEDFDTADLKDAKMLLDELNA
jgi:hypothetical protein